MTTRGDARAAIQQWVADSPDASIQQLGDSSWMVDLAGENKRSIGLRLSLGDHTLVAEAHFMRAPDQNAAALYELLLKRHQRSYTLRFCVYDSGDVMLVGLLPLHAVTADEVDRMAGAVLTVADETYNAALRLGFEGYITREQQWREDRGMPRNPIT